MHRLIGGIAALALVAFAGPALAGPVSGWSGDGSDVLVSDVSGSGSITQITPNSQWSDVSDDAGLAPGTAKWISYADTGVSPDTTVAPNISGTRTIGNETAHFRRNFSLGRTFALDLWILTDDTAEVTLTGPGGTSTLFSAFTGQIDPCAPGGTGVPIGCVEADMGITTVSGLAAGSYSLDVYAFQTNGDGFGSQYAFDTDVPEPATIGLIGMGLAGIGFVAHRRRKTA